jgi:ATP-binding cassette subfamily B protein
MDCGPACLKMILKYHGRTFSFESLRRKSYLSREGVSLLSISEAAESIGLKTIMYRLDFESFAKSFIYPCVVHGIIVIL